MGKRLSLAGKRKKPKKTTRSKSRKISLKLGIILASVLTVWGLVGEWFVHHPREWIRSQPQALNLFLGKIGNPLADITDSLGWTGHDAVYEYDTEAPAGAVLFAGAPKRIAEPAPQDIRILDRGEFII